MALPWVKYVSVLASALKAVAFWGVGTEEKLWGKKFQHVTLYLFNKSSVDTRIQLLLLSRRVIGLRFSLRLFKDNRGTGDAARRICRSIK